ncbi:MAG: aminopeptidase P family protein [Candidatus Zixiibacteriota bacterium]|nr:MAG: aminopeptidase P family protein [candidate division Zixibacteria bacterium]
MTDQRIQKAFSLLKRNKIDCMLVTELNHVRYLSGYSGSNGMVLLIPPKAYFFTDFRYKVQSQKEVKNCAIVIAEQALTSELPKIPKLNKKIRIGLEAEFVTLSLQERLKDLLPKAVFKSTEKLIESLSITKDINEIKKIKKAIKISEKAFAETLDYIKPGVREKDIALELEYKMRLYGADSAAFDIIVASGQRSSMPHGVASEKKLRKGDFITIDFGCFYQGYASDITRTVMLGKANEKQREIYNIVLEAQLASCKAVKPGLACSRLDGVARDIIMKAGYGDNFGHGLGHGIGLIVHDLPQLNARSTETLKPNMVVTIEPGIYIPNWGGVRIEDDVVVTPSGAQILSKLPKELMEL